NTQYVNNTHYVRFTGRLPMKPRFKQRLRVWDRRLRRFLSRKISTRLILTNLGLGTLPLILVSIFLITLARNTVQTYIYERNMETARRASNEIYRFIKEPLIILHTLSISRDIASMDPFIQSTLINKVQDENPIFRKIFVVNDSGLVHVTTKFGEERHDCRQEPYFRSGLAGQSYLSDVYFTPSRFPVLTVAEPIRRFNQVVGVLVAEIDLQNIWRLVDNITIGSTGIALLLSEEGKVIAHKDKSKVLEREDYSHYPFFRRLIAGEAGTTTLDIEGQETIVVFVPVQELGWGVVVQQSQWEAFTLAREMQQRVALFVALTTVIAIILGVLGVQRFTRPLLQLVQGVREYGQGNLKHRIEMKRQDELAELAQEFNSMAASLLKNQKELRRMERLAALSRFAALVSHEVRNPLNAMNINIQILKRLISRQDVSPEKKAKYLNIISTEISRINELVTNFLTIARPPELSLIRTPIHAILEEVIQLQEPRARADGITIVRRFASQSITGMFDYNQLKQVFLNIVVNAFEAMKEGGTLEISTEAICKEEPGRGKRPFVRIEFKDSGVGIPREILTEVFDFYYTTKRSGTGLGLAIAKQIVEAHQGIVYIESEKGVGTSVFIELPVDEVPRESPVK
ncbi:MAG: HAMP domain-containing protein, partial [Calditrichaeota bacterium]